MNGTLEQIAVGLIVPSPENPRKRMEYASLAESIREHGVLQPLLVRARGPYREGNAVEVRRHFELLCGERRWRASQAAGLATVPCIVVHASDQAARELRWVENLQRADLDPIEEAQGFQALLGLEDEGTGVRLYTPETLEARFHKPAGYVSARLPLCSVPVELADAVSERRVSPQAAAMVGRMPDEAVRAAMVEQVLLPTFQEHPLVEVQVMRLVVDRYCRPIREATFPTREAGLGGAGVPACGACPHNTANRLDADAFPTRKHLCTHLSCWRTKTQAAWDRAAAVAAGAGHRVLTLEESAEVYPPEEPPGVMAPTSPYVEASWTPDAAELKPEVEKPPTWRELVGDVAVPVVCARRQDGLMVELMERRLCREAVRVRDERDGSTEGEIFRKSEKLQSRPPARRRGPDPEPEADAPRTVLEWRAGATPPEAHNTKVVALALVGQYRDVPDVVEMWWYADAWSWMGNGPIPQVIAWAAWPEAPAVFRQAAEEAAAGCAAGGVGEDEAEGNTDGGD